MVRALISIRDAWIKVSPSVGTPPILVLSYKNHAIDEFLSDLVAVMPRGSLYNKLIRIGGQCKDPRLQPYSERQASRSDLKVNLKRQMLEDLHNVKTSISNIISEGSMFQSYYLDIFGKHDETLDDGAKVKARNKASNEATEMIIASLVRVHRIENIMKKVKDSEHETNNLKQFHFLASDPKDLMKSKDIKTRIDGLTEQVQHYNHQHPGDIVYDWIRGLKPLPRCTFVPDNNTSKGCRKLSHAPSPALCVEHQCRYVGGEVRCHRPVKQQGKIFCLDHSCDAEDCESHRIDKQKFCRFHCCKKCVELGLTSELAVDDPPRNVCLQHPICSNIICLNYAKLNSYYCADHELLVCKATTKRGNKCSNRSISRSIPFCRDHVKHLSSEKNDTHISKSEEMKMTTNTYEPSKCTAQTKKGRPCKGWALSGSKFCYDHSSSQDLLSGMKSELPSDGSHKKEENSIPCDQFEDIEQSKTEEVQICTVIDKNDVTDAKDCTVFDFQINKAALDTKKDHPQDIDICDRSEIDPEAVDPEDEAEYLKHLRDVFEVKDEDDSDESFLSTLEIPLDNDLDVLDDTAAFNLTDSDSASWNWEMSIDARWNACHALMYLQKSLLIDTLEIVKNEIINARKQLKHAKIRANARVYENRSVIGGTMVGCISRLDAIRSTNPFAIVVEEASEVLEPLLFSCLCNSTCKLEMIGDHLQLQPSTMNRFEFEIMNKTNVSMFQRLIQAPQGHKVPSAVLSTQRRMRTEICDLTRRYYKDIITIDDHPLTMSQTIGSKNGSLSALIKKTETEGREVPGILPHIYLWTHSGKQEKARVGLSRINETEATMICNLASYIVKCGVPRQSIAILTPYKGQLMLMRDKLLKDKKYTPSKLLSRDSQNLDVCRLSTVDRFQGDENDIGELNSYTQMIYNIRKSNTFSILLQSLDIARC
jgi:hypothetical protein